MRIATLLLGSLLLAGCEGDDDDDDIRRWEADLEGTPDFADVSGTALALLEGSTTRVTVTIAGAPVGGEHPWHIHTGTCATGGPILGDPAAYPFLVPNASGQDTRSATIDEPLLASLSYHVNVHASPTDLDTIVACGDLVRTG